MIGGDKIYSDINGISKISDINPNFTWNDFKYIEGFEYSINSNELEEEVSYLKILFLMECDNKLSREILTQFEEVNNLKMLNIGGKYNQIMGFEIKDQIESGWERKQRYLVHDYENGMIEFYCKDIKVL